MPRSRRISSRASTVVVLAASIALGLLAGRALAGVAGITQKPGSPLVLGTEDYLGMDVTPGDPTPTAADWQRACGDSGEFRDIGTYAAPDGPAVKGAVPENIGIKAIVRFAGRPAPPKELLGPIEITTSPPTSEDGPSGAEYGVPISNFVDPKIEHLIQSNGEDLGGYNGTAPAARFQRKSPFRDTGFVTGTAVYWLLDHTTLVDVPPWDFSGYKAAPDGGIFDRLTITERVMWVDCADKHGRVTFTPRTYTATRINGAKMTFQID
jgi:hypothetical protein